VVEGDKHLPLPRQWVAFGKPYRFNGKSWGGRNRSFHYPNFEYGNLLAKANCVRIS
jgi:hypothetical protein